MILPLPMDIRSETIFTLLRLPTARVPRRVWWILAALVMLGWIGAVAYLGRYRPNQVADILLGVAAREILFGGALVLALASAVTLSMTRAPRLAGAALMVFAFLVGHLLYAWIYPRLSARLNLPFLQNTDALGFAAARLVYGVALVAPMLLAWWLAFARQPGWPRLAFSIGDFRVAVRDVQAAAPPIPAGRALLTGYALFCVILFIVMQANVGFGPVRNGTLWPLLPAIGLAAVTNALAEEVIFRGLIQPAFIRAGGVAAGLWMQGLLFGLMHWGMSVGVLAALPVSLLIGLGSVVWGKIAVDTGGLGWVVLAHMMVDLCVMSAFFVPRG
jgi:uncharacterized protein